MSSTTYDKLQYLNETKAQIKKAIIDKGQQIGDNDTFRSYVAKIEAIETGTPINNQNKSVTPGVNEQEVTFDSGYTGLGTVTVGGDTDLVAGNIKSGINIFGVVGSVVEANNTTTTITPTTSSQTVTPDSPYNGFSSVTVPAVTSTIDANITAANIKSGVEILGVEGTYAGEAPVLEDKIITSNGEYTAGQGYDGIGTATVAVNATGHTEVAVNYTGLNIAAGDKVWMNQYWYSSNDSRTINYPSNPGYSSGPHDFLTPNGQFIFLNSTGSFGNYGLWKINNNNTITKVGGSSTESECFNYSANYPATQLALESDGVVYTQNSYGMRRIDSGWGWGHSNWYPVRGSSEIIIDKENMALQKIDPSDGTVLKTYSFDTAPNFNSYLGSASSTNGYYLGNGKIWLFHYSSGYYVREYILNDSNNTAEYQREFSDASLYLIHGNVGSAYYDGTTGINITSDYKYIIGGNIVFSIAENKNIYSETPMSLYHSDGRVDYYYPDTNTWIIEYGSGILIFKYDPNTEEFTKINFDSDSHKPISNNAHIYCISSDLSLVFSKNYDWTSHSNFWLYSTTKNVTNSLINYSQGLVSSDTITGTAAENIALGASGNVYLGDKGNLQSKAATSNGTVTPSEGYYGLSKVIVNVVGTGAEVEGKNYTGAVINEGDKVWINPYYYEAGTKFSINNSMSGNYGAVLTPDGSKYIATNKLYNVSDNSNLGTFANTSSVSYSNEFRVFSNGEMYRTVGGYLQRCDSGLSWNRQNTYPIFGTSEYIYNSSTNAIEQIDPNDGSTIKSYGFSDSNASWLSYSNSFFAIFIDKNHILWPIGISNNNGNTCIVHLDDDNNAVVLGNNANINLCFHYISNPNRCCCMGVTSDKKYALVTTSSSSFNIYKLGDGSNITEIVNSDLKLDTSFLGNSYNCCAIYYTDKDILFNNKVNSWSSIYSGTNLNNTKVYKYNPSTEEFKQVSIDFEGLFGGTGFGVSCVNGMIDIWYTQHSTGWKYVLTSEEKSGNNLVNYGSAVTSSTQTGTATESIATGATGTVKVGAALVPTLETLAITPTTSAQTIIPATGVDGYDEVTVSAVTSSIDANILAGNIKKDVKILGVTGSYEGASINNQNKSITVDGSYTADAGYTGLGTVTVTAGAVASAATQNEIAEELMLINDGATTFTLTVSPTDATPVITSTTNSVVLTPSSSSGGVSVYSISANSLKTYSYSVSKEGYVTSTGTINGGTASLTVTLVAESQGGGGLPEEEGMFDPSDGSDEAL